MKKFLTISEVSKSINLIDEKTKKPLNHVIRFWENEFKQIKPQYINNRRHYSSSQVETIKLIKFLLKNKGMTISGVKRVLNSKINKLDDYDSNSLKADYYRKSLSEKSKTILNKIKKIKKYGKKNPH